MKKLIAFLVILAVVLTGVFAVPEPGDQDSQVKVTLRGTVGEYFRHGVKENDELVYEKTYDSENVLSATGTTFSYGYKSNQAIAGSLYVDYIDGFKKNNDVIQVGTLKIGGSPMTGADYTQGKGFEVFAQLGLTNMNIISTDIVVIAAQAKAGNDPQGTAITKIVDEAPKGTYTLTLTFSVVGN
ncbi:MAG: hypothetical protein GX911_05565 [Spirochaetales bacterium]|nr:hypothetical protein [Spirochaetales bacterium]